MPGRQDSLTKEKIPNQGIARKHSTSHQPLNPMRSLKSWALAFTTLLAVSGYSQGTINFANKITGSVDAKIIDSDTGLGASGSDGFFAQLYVGADAGSLVAAGSPVPLRSDAGIGYVVASIVTTSLPGGSTALVQMRAWTGAATYENATRKGSSATLNVRLGDPSATPPEVPPSLVGLGGFTMPLAVPEPSTMSLAAAGCLALVGLKRNQRRSAISV
jgi:hypothetical protein